MATSYRAPQALPPRLAAVAARVPVDLDVVDVGTDHGHLALHLAIHGTGRRVMAVDRSARALDQARATFARLGARAPEVHLVVSEGLGALAPGAVQVVAIAGMGGHTVVDILRAAEPHHPHLQRLVLQPNDHLELVRQALQDLGFPLVEEKLLFDRERPYVVLCTGPRGAPRPPWSAEDALLGPLLRHAPSPDYDRWLHREEGRLRQAVSAAEAGGSEAPAALLEALGFLEQALSQRGLRP